METIIENFWLITIISLPLIYWYMTRNFNFWSKRGINGPKPKPVFGTLWYLLNTPRPVIEIAWIKKYGKIYGAYNGNQPTLVVADPELIKNILVKDFHMFADRNSSLRLHPILSKTFFSAADEDWKRLRSIVSPAFTSGKMKKMYPMIKDCLAEFLDYLENNTQNGKTDINALDMFGNFTMDVMATCAFATKTNAYTNKNNLFVKNAYKVFNPNLYKLIITLFLPESFKKALHLYSHIDESANDFFFQLTRHIINERKTGNKNVNDFIQLVLNEERNGDNREEVLTRDVNDVDESQYENKNEEELKLKNRLFNGVSNRYITEDEILAQAWSFFNAGYETTTNALAFASYELALNPVIQQKLYEEVLTALDVSGDIDYDILWKLPFLDSVISETLRLYPPLVSLRRKTSQEYNLSKMGLKLNKGQVVQIAVYALHHLKEYFENPLEFHPDRFMPENKHKIEPYSYLPFGSGPRNCIGMRFALMEAKLGLAQLVRRFRITPTAQTDIPLKLKVSPITNLLSAQNVIISLEKRR